MALSVQSSGLRHIIPVTTQNKHAKARIMMLSGYTSKLVNVTPTMVMMLAPHPISLLLFLKKVN